MWRKKRRSRCEKLPPNRELEYCLVCLLVYLFMAGVLSLGGWKGYYTILKKLLRNMEAFCVS